jgi:hypothetical protein
MATEASKKVPKSDIKYSCLCCDYSTSRYSQYTRHLTTDKHLKYSKSTTFNHSELLVPKHFTCNNCNKKYKDRSGLWKHSKICTINIEPQTSNEPPQEDVKGLTSLILELMKSNTELQKQLVDVCKNNNTNSHNTNHINSHNKTFNLQFFLNEQCKDAMNISEFADSFDLQLSDLESVGELGYVEGITKIFVDKLNSMDIYKRPIHCSDAKREILYVKDDNKWEKEEKNNPKIRYTIKTISFRNMKLANLWSDTYPESKDGDSRLNDT